MQNPGWRYFARLAMASVAGSLIGCAEPSAPADAALSDSSNGVINTVDWEMQWAQAALERNPNLEIITADRDLRTFVVRDRHNAMTAEVQLAQIAATPIEFLGAPLQTPTKPEAVVPAEPEAVTRLVENDSEPQAPAELKSPSYTIDRSSGLIRISGPGVSIESSGEPRAVAFGQSLDDAEVEPVICEGPRVMQLDNRIINVKGDALTARGGCELYITNSTVVASGTGVVIGDAIVHINNSRIEGKLAPFEADERAKVFLRGSTLSGLPRRSAQALIQDQGGNSYQ